MCLLDLFILLFGSVVSCCSGKGSSACFFSHVGLVILRLGNIILLIRDHGFGSNDLITLCLLCRLSACDICLMICEHSLGTKTAGILCIRVTVCSIRFIIVYVYKIIVVKVRDINGHYSRYNYSLIALVGLSFLASYFICLVFSKENLSLKTSGIIIFVILERYGAIEALHNGIVTCRIGILRANRMHSYPHRYSFLHRLLVHELGCVYGNRCSECAYLLITKLL